MWGNSSPRLFDGPATYCIAVCGSLGTEFADRFQGLTIIPLPCNTACQSVLLVGTLRDQAALLGILNYLYNLAIPIWCVQRMCDETLGAPAPDQYDLIKSKSEPAIRG